MYANEIIGFEKAGLRPDVPTMDHNFILHSIVEYYKCKKTPNLNILISIPFQCIEFQHASLCNSGSSTYSIVPPGAHFTNLYQF